MMMLLMMMIVEVHQSVVVDPSLSVVLESVSSNLVAADYLKISMVMNLMLLDFALAVIAVVVVLMIIMIMLFQAPHLCAHLLVTTLHPSLI